MWPCGGRGASLGFRVKHQICNVTNGTLEPVSRYSAPCAVTCNFAVTKCGYVQTRGLSLSIKKSFDPLYAFFYVTPFPNSDCLLPYFSRLLGNQPSWVQKQVASRPLCPPMYTNDLMQMEKEIPQNSSSQKQDEKLTSDSTNTKRRHSSFVILFFWHAIFR